MADTGRAKATLPYIQRLLEDEFVQEQLLEAAGALRSAYARTRKQPAKAADDKQLYRNLRQAATSIRDAAFALRHPAPPPKRRLRKVATFAVAAGACVWLTTRLQKAEDQSSSDSGSEAAPVV